MKRVLKKFKGVDGQITSYYRTVRRDLKKKIPALRITRQEELRQVQG